MEKDYEDWVSECDRLSKELQEKAKSHKTMDELEDLVGEYNQKIGELMMQGVSDDKGIGSDQKPSRSKNKGLKKKTSCNKIAAKAGNAGEQIAIRELKPFPKDTKKEKKESLF
jgi:hypothetical protein